MISEVRPGVKQNLSETFSGSFGRRSTAADHWRSGLRWPAKVAPSPAATNIPCRMACAVRTAPVWIPSFSVIFCV
jgi:hypothetical protein